MRVFVLSISLVFMAALSSPATAEISQEEFGKLMKQYLDSESGQEVVGKSVQQYFVKQQKQARKRQAKEAENQMEEQFKNPVKIDAGSSPAKGPKDAPITIIEFSDFQCPYCSRGKDTMEQVLKAYPEKVRLVFKHLPLDFHPQAMPAAKASMAAAKQGKFWEMHDALFANARKLSDTFYEQQAKKLGLDIQKFKKDMASEEVKKQIEDDIKLARKHGITGTPGFFVNGVAVKGAYPVDHFKKIIDRWLAKK